MDIKPSVSANKMKSDTLTRSGGNGAGGHSASLCLLFLASQGLPGLCFDILLYLPLKFTFSDQHIAWMTQALSPFP